MDGPAPTSPQPEGVKPRRGAGRMVVPIAVLAILAVGAVGALGAGPWLRSAVRSAIDPASGTTPRPAGQTGSSTPTANASGASALSPAAGAGASGGPGVPAATPGLLTDAPWLAWRPSGHGSIVRFQLPAPWVGGTATKITVAAYLPPEYATSGRSYPVIYEAPFGYGAWEKYIQIRSDLDSLITSGAIPASIVVFVPQIYSPIVYTECANSRDGRVSFETFLSGPLVEAVDARYRTIAKAAARAVAGFSEGGFCAAMLVLRHPDVFTTALAVSGYFEAGIRTAETPNAWRVFGGNRAYEAGFSPVLLVGRLTAAQRSAVSIELEADPKQQFYGPQYEMMVAAAKAAGVSVVTEPMVGYHSWAIVKAVLPRMLQALGAHEVALGVFG